MNKFLEEKTVLVQEEFDLKRCASAIKPDLKCLWEKIRKTSEKIYKLRQELRPFAKANHELEVEVEKLDRLIKTIIDDRLPPPDINRMERSEMKANEVGLKNREDYEQMFYLLQKNPHYFADIVSKVEAGDMNDFVKTIIFDMYGDQFDSSEERLLLTLFGKVIEADFIAAGRKGDMGSLFRANTTVTMMLSQYARRGEGGKGVLRNVLAQPLQEMLSMSDLNLEMKPHKVYREVMEKYEQKSPEDDNISNESALRNKFVKQIIERRAVKLQSIVDRFLKSIIEHVDEVPYGIRWICKQFAEMGRKAFPLATRHQIGSLVGSYIFLRFFTPVICRPDTVNLLKGKKVSRKMHQNLVWIGKVLQNQSNGVHFRDESLKGLNHFLDENKENIQGYFQKLITIESLDDWVQIDKLLETTKRHQPSLRLKRNQIYLIYRLIWKYRAKWSPDEDPIWRFICKLGEPPEQVSRSNNIEVVLNLQPPESSLETSATPVLNMCIPLKHMDSGLNINQPKEADEIDGKRPIWVVLRSIIYNPSYPAEIFLENRQSLPAFLEELLRWAKSNKSEYPQLVEDIPTCIKLIDNAINVRNKDDRVKAYNDFLLEYAQYVRFMITCEKDMRKKLKRIQEAKEKMSEHQEWLLKQKKSSTEYLENVMRWETSAKKNQPEKTLTLKHSELERLGVICSVFHEEKPKTLKKLTYIFKKISKEREPSVFQLDVKYTERGKEMDVGSEIIKYRDLRKLQIRKSNVYTMFENINFSVNHLAKMLDAEFGTSRARSPRR